MTYCSAITCSNNLPCKQHWFVSESTTPGVIIKQLLHAIEISESTIRDLRNDTNQEHLPLFERLRPILDAIAQECPSEAKTRCQIFVQKIVPSFSSLRAYEDAFCRALNGMLRHASGHIWAVCNALCNIEWDFANTLVQKYPYLVAFDAFGIFVIHCCLAPISRDQSAANLAVAMMQGYSEFDIVLTDKHDDETTWFLRSTWVNILFYSFFVCVYIFGWEIGIYNEPTLFFATEFVWSNIQKSQNTSKRFFFVLPNFEMLQAHFFL